MSKRLFIGIPINEDLQGTILEWKQKSRILISNSQIRWIEAKNLHVTLVPPWYEDDYKAISSKLEAISGQSFRLEFNRVTFGPNIREPRLIWASGLPGPEIFGLKNSIEKTLVDVLRGRAEYQQDTGWGRGRGKNYGGGKYGGEILERGKQASRDFKPHVTLARFRPEDFAKFSIKTLNESVNWQQIVNSFALYESHLSPKGADYEILSEFFLKKD